ncbi:hypothetical protein SAMN05880590_102278 [Rhizobium sp. RU35A]|uniref:hypothetical protein n=1 Tax=Rhizobium sp. RU35A TaxID=1907414 RepID=UPI0009558793|nr:hypothetical protein [Rhizobium sp. RU35A]SIQ15032.1 hypothetical protein SAMN05880590_102278 [Rhizobium sp. RU35A]
MKMFVSAIVLSLAGAGAALAGPVAPPAIAASQAAPGLVQQVDYACGPGWRLTRWGDCVPRRPPPPPRYYRPPPPPEWGWGPPPRHWHRPPPPPAWGWGPPPRAHWDGPRW